VDYYCFDIPRGFIKEINFNNFAKVGIKSTCDVGSELARQFKKLEYENIAESLNHFVKDRL